MKKFLMLLAFAGVSAASMAQSEVPVLKHSVATNSFWSNWFIQANVVGTAFYSNSENGMNLPSSPLKSFRNNLGASVAIGKWFTPGLGLRTKVNGIWGRAVICDDKEENSPSKYWQANEQVLFNLSNLLCGYSDTRVWNFIPYVGAGLARSMTYDRYAIGLQAGILNTWRLSKRVAINLDASFGAHENDFDGITWQEGHEGGRTSLKWRDRDLNVELGLTFNLGKATWEKTPDVDAIKRLAQNQIDALRAQLDDANAEIDRLNKLIANHKCPEVPAQAPAVKEFVATPVSVFFNINKANIASQKDLVNVKGIAKYAKDNNLGVRVDGYADSATGKAAYNQALSEKRAETVAKELVKLGVSRDKITTKGHGGVNELSPISFNRRATVQVVTD